ncbi:hypothetical protein SLEP1_g58905 [Rubroshorea leprosula]|uniref:RING-type E3 ubiquitin transferase n=1 Tax=Rubroshorea leprosula TaxID=152421 RepID=A0AAV5MUD8_9ROSI|nr:hypothetical protein SLEP1_g58905 [Rubroshorea leprosula]
MQGEGSNSDPFRDNYYYFDSGSGPRSLNLIQLMEAPDPQEDPLGQPGLNQETGQVDFIDLLTQERLLSLAIHQGPTSQRLEGSTNSGFHQFSELPLTFQGATEIIAVDLHAPLSSRFPQTHWANPNRIENLTVNGSESRLNHQMHDLHATANQMGRVSNVRPGHANSSHAGQRVARRRTRGPSPRIRSPTTAERRRRLINEVREALDNFRRVGSEHFRELIALGEQFEIIANEVEQIQVVDNGLTEETIMVRLSRQTYHPTGTEERRACSICQDEYAERDLLGKLDCGHDYHFECIKQWLMRKNTCPMCRHRALAI